MIDMDKYQIVEMAESQNHAGTKATADMAAIAEKLGFIRVPVRMNNNANSFMGKLKRQIGYWCDWKRAYNQISAGSILLLQHPFHHRQLTRDKVLVKLKQRKNVRIISVVHDVEELRAYRFNEYYKHEFEMMLSMADVLIVHNEAMKSWFESQGCEADKLVTLEIFDYLTDGDLSGKKILFDRSLTIAGNLDTTKSGYIAHVGELAGVKIHLYGPNFDESLKESGNVEYHGSFSANDLPAMLNEGFGLVWDGSSIDGCEGESGQYLKINNPHKLSLYLSAGLPIVIWKNAAEARFVEEKHLGITVDTLRDLHDVLEAIDLHRYKMMVENVNQEQIRLHKGYYSTKAIHACLDMLESN